VLGWRDLAAATRRLAGEKGAKSVLTDNREVTGELVYYLRDTSLPVLIWFREDGPRNQFEMKYLFTASAPEPVLYVTVNRSSTSVPKHSGTSKLIGKQSFPTKGAPLRQERYLLRGYEGDDD
jgi:hypothetical protein